MVATRVTDERGQASAELVAIIPALLIGVLVAAQIGLVGYALWSAGMAARAGARAAHVESDAEAAARSALPAPFRAGASVSSDEEVEVRIRVPTRVGVIELSGWRSGPSRSSATPRPERATARAMSRYS